MNALTYAAFFWDKVCHDGRIALDTKHGGYPAEIKDAAGNKIKLSPGLPLETFGPFVPGDEDCTHFISCCVGNTTHQVNTFDRTRGKVVVTLRGGGLHIPSPFQEKYHVYGQTYAPNLVYVLKAKGAKVMGEFMPRESPETRVAVLRHLNMGDILAYADRPDNDRYKHMAILVGPSQIACHTYRRRCEPFTDIKKWPLVTLLKLP
jgi:hypothetical protein